MGEEMPPAWRDPSFVAAFCDGYISGTELEHSSIGGAAAALLFAFERSWDTLPPSVRAVKDEMNVMLKTCFRLYSARGNVKKGEQVLAIVDQVLDGLRSLPVGKSVLILLAGRVIPPVDLWSF